MEPAVVILVAGRWLATNMGDFEDTWVSWLQSEREDRSSVRSVPTAGVIPGSRRRTLYINPISTHQKRGSSATNLTGGPQIKFKK